MYHKHKQRFHLSRLVLTSLLGIALLFSRSHTAVMPLAQYAGKRDVLAYATGVSISGLLAAGNASRANNGLGALSMSSLLNSSAQAKANDMIAKDYWAHVAPDGTEPWYFFDQAGYVYTKAGENLAYGFDTSDDVNTGWMNSPTHRDNVLGDYTEVGYGIASGANYQGGEFTVIVAHYGKPPAPQPAPTPVTTTPTQPTLTPTPTTSASPSPSTPVPTTTTATGPPTQSPTPTEATPTSTETPSPTDAAPDQKTTTPTTSKLENKPDNKTPGSTTVAVSGSPKKVSALQQLLNGQASTPVTVSLGIVTISTAGFAATHRRFVKKVLEAGKKLSLHHPVIDLALIAVTLGIILSATVGNLL